MASPVPTFLPLPPSSESSPPKPAHHHTSAVYIGLGQGSVVRGGGGWAKTGSRRLPLGSLRSLIFFFFALVTCEQDLWLGKG